MTSSVSGRKWVNWGPLKTLGCLEADSESRFSLLQLQDLLPPLSPHKAGSNEDVLRFGSELYRIQIQLEGEFLSAFSQGTFRIADVRFRIASISLVPPDRFNAFTYKYVSPGPWLSWKCACGSSYGRVGKTLVLGRNMQVFLSCFSLQKSELNHLEMISIVKEVCINKVGLN